MGSGCRLFIAATAATALLGGAPARADEKTCTGLGALSDNVAIGAAKVTAGGKTYFVKSGMDDKRCPADTDQCRRKAFLVAGNAILIGGRTEGFVCATFVNGKGVETSGWLPAASVAADTPAGAPGAQDWLGTWVREEATIKIKPDAKDALAIAGDATYGAMDPDRVKRGAVNIGSIAAKLAPKGDKLSFAMGDDDKTLPVDKGDDFACKVWMRRAGPYLLVDDNTKCGGFNVSFAGTYVRR